MAEIVWDAKKLNIVETEKIKPNDYNPKLKDTEEYKRVEASVKAKGLRLPIVVREVEGNYEIIDGEQRWRACKNLGFEKVLIYNEGQMDDKEAKELTIWYQQQVSFDEILLSEVVRDIIKRGGLPEDLPYTEEEIQDYMKLGDFNWGEVEAFTVEVVDDESVYEYSVDKETVMEIKKLIEKRKPKKGTRLIINGVKKFHVLTSQYEVIERAIEAIKKNEGIEYDGKALELICADFLGGA